MTPMGGVGPGARPPGDRRSTGRAVAVVSTVLVILAVLVVLQIRAKSTQVNRAVPTTSSPFGGRNGNGLQYNTPTGPIDLGTTGPPVQLEGNGNAIRPFTNPSGLGKPFLLRVDYDGTKAPPLTISGLAATGRSTYGVGVYTTGTSFHGTVLCERSVSREDTTQLKISARGRWTATITSATSARTWDGTTTLSGDGPDVIRVAGGLDAPITAEFDAHYDPTDSAANPDDAPMQGLSFLGTNKINGPMVSIGSGELGPIEVPTDTYFLQVLGNAGKWTITPTH